MKPNENSSQPMIQGAVSLPLPNIKKGKTVFGGSDDDVSVCLNCTRPVSKCRGKDDCYMKQKLNGGGSNE